MVMVEEVIESKAKDKVNESGEAKQEARKINYFEKLLPIWVVLCIIIGIILSQFVPEIGQAINSLQIGGISIPIGISGVIPSTLIPLAIRWLSGCPWIIYS